MNFSNSNPNPNLSFLKQQAGFLPVLVAALLVVVLGGIGYAGYRVVHKPPKGSSSIASTNPSSAVTKYTGQSATNGQPLAKNSTSTDNNATTKTSTSSVTTNDPKASPASSNTPTTQTAAQTPAATPANSFAKGYIYNTYSCGNIPAGGGPCSNPTEPYQATVVVQTSSGSPVTSFTSNADGSFIIRLEPGTYVFVPQTYNSGATSAPTQTVAISPNGTSIVTINYRTNVP